MVHAEVPRHHVQALVPIVVLQFVTQFAVLRREPYAGQGSESTGANSRCVAPLQAVGLLHFTVDEEPVALTQTLRHGANLG